jgi:hypothetical protein
MNETLDKLIKQSGEMWAGVRDRTQSPLLLSLSGDWRGKVFELSLPEGEGHPFWRINERQLTSEESETFGQAIGVRCQRIGDLMQVVGESVNGAAPYMRVCAYIFNGRKYNEWNICTERVRAQVELED